MDSELRAAAEALFSKLGINISTAFNIYVRQSLREGGIPFMITANVPNQDTIDALGEYDAMKNHSEEYKRYDSFSELLGEVLTDA